MDSAKEIARDMLEAINVDGSGFWGAVGKGFISLPVSFGYLGYDFMDTDHRRENLDDKLRIAGLVKKGVFRRELIERAIGVFIDDFVSRIDIKRVRKIFENTVGSSLGKVTFSQVTGVNLGAAITSGAVSAFFSGILLGSLLFFGAEASRSIYTSRELRIRNPVIYERLKKAGDLDLLYFLIEDVVKPFEKACEINKCNPEEFNKICDCFFGGL